MANIVTSGDAASFLGATKINDPARSLTDISYEIDALIDYNPLRAGLVDLAEHLYGVPDENSKWMIAAYGQAVDPLAATLAGMGAGTAHLWWDSTDDAWKFRESGVATERTLLDDQGVSVVQLPVLGSAPAVAPAGTSRLYTDGSEWFQSHDTGAWTSLAGGGAGDIEGVTAGAGLTGGGTTGTVTLDVGAGTGITVNANDVAINLTHAFAWNANHTYTTGNTITVGTNLLVTSDLLNAAKLTGAVPAANGGTGQAGGYAVGDMLYASGASALSKLAAVAVGQVLASAGTTTAPAYTADPVLTSLTLTSTMKLLSWTSDRKYLAMAEAAGSPSYRGVMGQGARGTDITGGALRLQAGYGTGAGVSGHVEIWHSQKAATGASAQTLYRTWYFANPASLADETRDSHLLPHSNLVCDIGSTSQRIHDLWADNKVYANVIGDPDDTDSFLTWGGSNDVALTLGGTSRHKVSTTYARYALNGGVYKDSSAFEVIVGGAGADGRGRFENNISSTGVSGIIATNDNNWSGTMLLDGSGTTRTGVAGNTYFVGLTSVAHFGALTNTDSHWITGTADSTADRVASAIYNAGNRYLKIGYFVEYTEMTAPAAGASNTARVFAVDSGGGKTILKCQFSTGAAQTIATEP